MNHQINQKTNQPTSSQLKQALGLGSAIALVMGSMIGSGIFIVPADISRGVNSPALMIAAWLITGFMTVVAALSYGELAAMMPKAGGQYVFLRESLGPIWGFLYGWTLFLVIQTGTIAAVAVAFGKFAGVLFPQISAQNWIVQSIGLHTQNLVAITVILLLTGVNILGVKSGALVQNIFTTAKTLALIALIIVGLTIGRHAIAIQQNFGAGQNGFTDGFWKNISLQNIFPVHIGNDPATVFVGIFTILAIVQVGSLFSADAWNNVTFTSAEVKNPARNLPLALAIGTGSVILLYILANVAYLSSLPLSAIQQAHEDRVGTAMLQQTFASGGAQWMAIAIMISTFGGVNGMTMAGARVYYAMSEDGLFFKAASKIHPKYDTPVVSLLLQGTWAAILCLTGTYSQLLDYIIFAVLLFYILTMIGLFVLRKKLPDAPRPYRAIGYPVLPAIYIIMAVFIDLALLRYKPQYTWPGLLIVCSGIPVYWMWKSLKTNSAKRNSTLEATDTP
jgi:basic amino acid/polyamine antiporter, APA family